MERNRENSMGNHTEKNTKEEGTFADVWANRGPDAPRMEDFREKIGLEILERRPGYAKGQIVLQPWHLNVLGIVHGGVLFTIADTVSGTAAVTGHDYAVPTVNGTINYLKAGRKTSKIIAEAREIKNGNTFSVVECQVFDDRENLLATTSMTFYHLKQR